MMIKYRVHEVAKDLNILNKDIIDLLEKYCEDKKKHMTALTEQELDIILESFTQKNKVKNFDAYFAERSKVVQKKGAKEKKTKEDKPVKEHPKEIEKTIKKEKKMTTKTIEENENIATKTINSKRSANGEEKTIQKEKIKNKLKSTATEIKKAPIQEKRIEDKAAVKSAAVKKKIVRLANKAIPKKQEEPKIILEEHLKKKPNARVVDTRTSNVNMDKYNEKYDQLASEKVKTENIVKKQKLTQRSAQYRGKTRKARRETESERLNRISSERKKKQLTIQVPEEITVGELALRLKATVGEVIKKLMGLGVFVTVNDVIDFDTTFLVASEFHTKIEKEVIVTIEERIIDDRKDENGTLVLRAPVVVVMGHVDHGKTSLLDAIREEKVTSTEAGGITQHIGAYRVKTARGEITFLDTPGHEAFTTMRARGAQVTDIVVLVVASDDGIMAQTIEAINHAKEAGVSIIVAINKIDKVTANPNQIKQQLTEHGLVPEEWGGDIPCILVSAKQKYGLDDLLEIISLVAEMKELKANPDRAAKGTVIESRLDKGRGPIATVLVQNGTLHTGDILVAGTAVGRVRAMLNNYGEKVEVAGPSMPVEIIGLNDVPEGGDIFNAVSDERLARELVEQRRSKKKEETFNTQTKVTLANLFDQVKAGQMQELKIVVKSDVQGSLEAVRQSLEKLSNEEVRVYVIHGGVGAINESDVMLAQASHAIIIGFNVRPEPMAEITAKRNQVDMRMYRVIYKCIEEMESAMKGLLVSKYREIIQGRAECREVYKVSSIGVIAGCHVISGKVTRISKIRVVRDGIVMAEDTIHSLRRFKDDVKEVAENYDCGIYLENFMDIKEGDIFEAFIMEEYRS